MQGEVRSLADQLPVTDEALHRLIESQVASADEAAVASPLDAEMLFESICKVRDQMDLPPEDPGEWMLDHLYNLPEELDEETREELAVARRQMDAAAAEASRLRTQLAETRAQLERQERLAARKKTAPATRPHQSPHRKYQRPNSANGLTNSNPRSKSATPNAMRCVAS